METETAATSVGATTDSETVEQLIAIGFSREMLDALDAAIAATKLVHHAPGDIIYREATGITALYVIRNGRIKLLNYTESGRARIVRLHNRGSIIGLNGLMEDTHAHTAVAIDEVSTYQIPMHLIRTVRDNDLNTYCRLLEYWHEYLQMADTWITDFSTGAIRGRVARLLRYLVETNDATGPREVSMLTVEEMAEILGVTPESVSRTMASLKRENILQVSEQADHYRCNLQQLLREAEK